MNEFVQISVNTYNALMNHRDSELDKLVKKNNELNELVNNLKNEKIIVEMRVSPLSYESYYKYLPVDGEMEKLNNEITELKKREKVYNDKIASYAVNEKLWDAMLTTSINVPWIKRVFGYKRFLNNILSHMRRKIIKV